MRFVTLLRIWEKTAFVTFLACANPVFANTLAYYYGYRTPDFGPYQGVDALSSQNVSMAPQLPMVTFPGQFEDSNIVSMSTSLFAQAASASATVTDGYPIMVQSFGYPLPATSPLLPISLGGSSTQSRGSTIIVGATYTAPTVVDIASAMAISSLSGVSGSYSTLGYTTLTASEPPASGARPGSYSSLLVNIVPTASYSTEWGLVVAGIAPAYHPVSTVESPQ